MCGKYKPLNLWCQEYNNFIPSNNNYGYIKVISKNIFMCSFLHFFRAFDQWRIRELNVLTLSQAKLRQNQIRKRFKRIIMQMSESLCLAMCVFHLKVQLNMWVQFFILYNVVSTFLCIIWVYIVFICIFCCREPEVLSSKVLGKINRQ